MLHSIKIWSFREKFRFRVNESGVKLQMVWWSGREGVGEDTGGLPGAGTAANSLQSSQKLISSMGAFLCRYLLQQLALKTVSHGLHGEEHHYQRRLPNSIYSWEGGQQGDAELTGRRLLTQPAESLQS